MKLKIISDGTKDGTQVVHADTGEALENVRSVEWKLDARFGVAEGTIQFYDLPVEVVFEGDFNQKSVDQKPTPEPKIKVEIHHYGEWATGGIVPAEMPLPEMPLAERMLAEIRQRQSVPATRRLPRAFGQGIVCPHCGAFQIVSLEVDAEPHRCSQCEKLIG